MGLIQTLSKQSGSYFRISDAPEIVVEKNYIGWIKGFLPIPGIDPFVKRDPSIFSSIWETGFRRASRGGRIGLSNPVGPPDSTHWEWRGRKKIKALICATCLCRTTLLPFPTNPFSLHRYAALQWSGIHCQKSPRSLCAPSFWRLQSHLHSFPRWQRSAAKIGGTGKCL